MFCGGLSHSAFSREKYPDLLLPDSGAEARLAYLVNVRKASVVVTSDGLYGSIGFRLPEFLGQFAVYCDGIAKIRVAGHL